MVPFSRATNSSPLRHQQHAAEIALQRQPAGRVDPAEAAALDDRGMRRLAQRVQIVLGEAVRPLDELRRARGHRRAIGCVRIRPPSSGRPAQEIGQDADADLLALLDVELRAGPVAARHHRHHRAAVIRAWRAPGRDRRRSGRSCERNRHGRPERSPRAAGARPARIRARSSPSAAAAAPAGPSRRSRPGSSRSPASTACSSPRSAISCMPDADAEERRAAPRSPPRSPARMPGTAPSPRAQSAKAPCPGSTIRSARATASGSAVTDDLGRDPGPLGGERQRARGGGEIAAAVVDHRDLHRSSPSGTKAAGEVRPAVQQPRQRRLVVARREHVRQRVAAPRQRPAHQVAPEQPLAAIARPERAATRRGRPSVSAPISIPARDRARPRSRRACASSQSGPKKNAPQLQPSRTSIGPPRRRAHARSRIFTARPWSTGIASPPRGSGSTAIAQRPGRRLEAGLRDVMRVAPGAARHVQREQRVHREGAEELLEQLGIHLADLGPLERHVPGEERPAGDVDRRLRQRLVHRHQRVAEAADAALVAERLGDRAAEHDADILGGVVEVDMQVALRAHRRGRTARAGRARSACGRESRCRWRSRPSPARRARGSARCRSPTSCASGLPCGPCRQHLPAETRPRHEREHGGRKLTPAPAPEGCSEAPGLVCFEAPIPQGEGASSTS